MTKRQPTSPQDWMVDLERRLKALERRTHVSAPGDLLGPGIDTQAILTHDWSGEEMGFNGLYYSRPGAKNVPRPGNIIWPWSWIGWNIVDPDGYGYQKVTRYRWEDVNQQNWVYPSPTYTRTFAPGVAQNSYSTWAPNMDVIFGDAGSDIVVNSTSPIELGNLSLFPNVYEEEQEFLVMATIDVVHNGVTDNGNFKADIRLDNTIIASSVFHAKGINNLRVTIPVNASFKGAALAGGPEVRLTGLVGATPEQYTVQSNSTFTYIALS